MAWRTDGGMALLEHEPETPLSPAPGAGRTAGRTVAALIGLNLVIQIGVIAAIVANDLDRATAVRVSLLTGVVFYAAAALATRLWSDGVGIHPVTGARHPLAGAAEGIVVGAGAAALLTGLLRLAFGHPLLDPTSGALAAGGGTWLALGVIVVAVLAPVVEELVFRGFLLEAFRARGRRSAVLISAVAFSLAHLQLAGFRYYLVMGAAFALVYWRRGLVGSIAAHAAFNGMLLLVAVATVHGPARQISTAGFKVTLPPAWTTATGVAGDDLAASGPLGTRVELAHVDANRALTVEAVAGNLTGGAAPLPDRVSVDPTSVAIVDLAPGRAVVMNARIDGRDGRVVLVPKGSRLWVATVRSASGDDWSGVFADIVGSWRLP